MSAIQVRKPDFEAVKRLAWQVLEVNFVTEPPVIAARLARTYHLEALEADFKPEYDHIAGFIDFGKMKILANAKDNIARKNFTTAHELGHYLLNHNIENGYTVLLRDMGAMIKTPIEQEANCFAANVLVPKPFLRHYLDNYSPTNKQLAGVFGVSEDVIRYQKLYLR